MSDLISRKALLKALNKWDISKLHLVEDVKELVKEQPTAYDLDKIVERLEKARNVYMEMDSMYHDRRSQGRYEGYRHAIEIVKGGADNG